MNIKNKKGFTLVELLAVVIVLIIVIFIAITKVRESNLKAQMNAIQANAGSYIKAVNDLAGVDSLTSDRMYSGFFGKYILSTYGLKMSGTEPDTAEVYVNDFEVETACLSYGKYKVLYEDGKLQKPVVGKCISGDKYMFAYTGKEQVFTAPISGTYVIEAWGAQGGDSRYIYNSDNSNTGGYGGYSTGEVYLEEGDKLYINVGGKGASVTYNQSSGEVIYDESTGYNGGGYAAVYPENSSHSGGGGASHIAYKTGLLTSFKIDLESLIMVAGGGGGASTHLAYPNYSGTGGSGGGYIGGAGVSESNTCYHYGTGGTQSAIGGTTNCPSGGRSSRDEQVPPAPDFGKGSSYASNLTSNGYAYGGGGGGFYGGQSGYHAPGGGGSGYIGSPILSNKSMYCYNCSESSDSSVKTFKTTCVESEAKSKCAKKGNGAVVITLAKPGACDNCKPAIYNFGFTDGEETLAIPVTGTYKLEVWGAQGGGSLQNGSLSENSAYGGYSVGYISLTAGDKLYINVGGKGSDGVVGIDVPGGYNGGGSGTWDHGDNESAGAGGGATHIALKSGLLSELSEDVDNVLIVAGGAGGKSWNTNGGSGGGFTGGPAGDGRTADQTSGYQFGKGQNATGTGANNGHGGGGGGFYGGYESSASGGNVDFGGGGSGYIGNPRITDKSMYCYNCTQSTEESTKTVSGTCSSLLAIENCAKIGNGYARISFVSNN